MRPTIRFVGIFATSLLFIPGIFAQTNPPARDANEYVTRDSRMLTRADDRAGAADLLQMARQKSDLRDVTTPYSLKISFETSGATQLEGKGTFEEFSDGTSRRWTAKLGDYEITRISDGAHVYSTNPTEPIPLRIQTVRSVVVSPIPSNTESPTMREATVKRDGKTMECVLSSGSIGMYAPPRAWTETEYCVDTATNLLQMWSEAPGVFALYDYAGAKDFHGHMLPTNISIYQEGHLTVKMHVESLEDLAELDPNLVTPTQEMLDVGEALALGLPVRFPIRVDPMNEPTSNYFQPVIVHVILDANDGSVIDAEPIQNYDPALTRAAMELLTNSAFEPLGFQRDAFINVQFHLPAGVAPTRIVIRTSVHWRILDANVRVAPPRRPRRVTK
jgi:hypothetical protein